MKDYTRDQNAKYNEVANEILLQRAKKLIKNGLKTWKTYIE